MNYMPTGQTPTIVNLCRSKPSQISLMRDRCIGKKLHGTLATKSTASTKIFMKRKLQPKKQIQKGLSWCSRGRQLPFILRKHIYFEHKTTRIQCSGDNISTLGPQILHSLGQEKTAAFSAPVLFALSPHLDMQLSWRQKSYM